MAYTRENFVCLHLSADAILCSLVQLFEMDEVSELFGFTVEEGEIVMHHNGGQWASPYGERLRAARYEGDKEGEARAAADYIDFIIRTGKVSD